MINALDYVASDYDTIDALDHVRDSNGEVRAAK